MQAIRDRLLVEEELDSHSRREDRDCAEEPFRGLVHGLPGTGKSRVIKWVIRMFEEVMKWQHGREFMCIAFQNKVAHAMNGYTLHTGGEVRVGQQSYDAMLESRDVDSLYTKIEAQRWLVFDEAFMNPDEILGTFAVHVQQAAPQGNRYYRRKNQEL